MVGEIKNFKCFIAIAGGSASGKSTFCDKLIEALPRESVSLIHVDSYYRAKDHLTIEERALSNYDHPDALEFELLTEHLACLKNGSPVYVPVYDYKTHNRTKEKTMVRPTPLVIIEGILSLYLAELRAFYDLKIFIDAPETLRLARRLTRDVNERGRTEKSIQEQWKATVQPMYVEYCEPCKKLADLVIDGSGSYESAVREVLHLIESRRVVPL